MDYELVEMLRSFIEKNSRVPDLQFDPALEPKLPVDPYSRNYEERKRTAHYLLLVASIDEGNVIGRADNARKLIASLYEHFDENLFEIIDESILKNALDNAGAGLPLGRLKGMIPKILASVNMFVNEKANGDLIEYSKKFHTPYNFVDQLGKSVVRMGKDKTSARKKAWMYMRWMVRDHPDLRIFDHFSPKDLFVPLDKNVARVAVCLGVLSSLENLGWNEVVRVTEFARTLYPDDPAKVDYPFFLLGREIAKRKLPLTAQTLKELLKTKT